jgi:Neprosin
LPDNSDAKGIQSFEDFRNEVQTAQHATYRAGPRARVAGPDAFEEQRQHLIKLYGGVTARHSFIDSAGQVFDCIPIEQQPALRLRGESLKTPPSLPGAAGAASKPPGAAFAPLGEGRVDRYGNPMSCPPGCVPMRRITLDELTRFETLGHYLRKSPRRGAPAVIEKPDAPSAAGPPHEYAHANQMVANLGGHSILNVWSPTVSAADGFSLAQHWYVAGEGMGLQTAEVGWQVYPQHYGQSAPVLFTYWTRDGYHQTGSYSLEGGDFVQYSSTCPVGVAIEDISQLNGDQAEIEIAYYLTNGAWWLFIGGSQPANAVGYYPVSLYQNGPMATGAAEIDYGGETVSSSVYPPMGSGNFASTGYKLAAYQRSIQYYDLAGAAQQANLVKAEQWPSSYTIEPGTSTDWGAYFYFGGPGG